MSSFHSSKNPPKTSSPSRPPCQMLPLELRTKKPPGRQPYSSNRGSGAQFAGPHGSYQTRSSANKQLPRNLPYFTEPIVREEQPWQSWPELTVKVGNLPPNVTTWQLWKRFAREGNVVFIEIFENRQGIREPNARVRFSPVPHQNFWSAHAFQMETFDRQGAFQLKVEPEGKRRDFQIQSPIRKSIWYPEIMTLRPSVVTFGLMYDENTMMTMYDATTLLRNDISFDINLARNRITVKFPLNLNAPNTEQDHASTAAKPLGSIQKYMFQIPFGQLEKIYRVQISEDKWALIINLDSPPQFYRRRPVEASHSDDTLLWSEFDAYLRQTDIVYDRGPLKTSPIALNKTMPLIDIGRWTTYRFTFDKIRNEPRLWEKISSALEDFNIEIVEVPEFAVIPGMVATVWPLLDPENSQTINNDLSLLEDLHSTDYTLPFDVRYQLEACISENCINEYNISTTFLRTLSKMASKNPEKAKNLLEYVFEQGNRVYNPMSIFDDESALAHDPKAHIPDYCARSRKATITPTTIYFSSPTVEITNRIIREFSSLGDRFIRVQFTDEKFEGRINSCADKVRNDEIFTRVYRTLTNGIRIGNRHYEFLAFGNSQFRENGAYFFCPTEDVTCARIRNWMGDFRHITVVAKCAARLGQCFSTTRAIGGRVQITPIEDVEHNGYCFTDGVGKISLVLATRIADELGLHTGLIPSVFQFRMGGCKGILAVSPEVKGQQALIRRSQQKFLAVYNGLEIIRCSQYSLATLNRQTITILSSLGVKDDIFNHMLTEQLSSYHEAMNNKSLALERLGQYVDQNHMTITIAEMILDGFMESKEPFLLTLLNLWRAWSIKLLKEKARIIVEKGAFLLGCSDETGTLRGHIDTRQKWGNDIKDEDLPEIFVQISKKSTKEHYMIIKGRCFLGRNPSLHPGDIRVVMAVDVPALHHLRDVVVFPQLGDRDIPSMCSGGDLDGDDFFVVWDPDLMPAESNYPPMDYRPPKPVELNRPVEIADMTRFFVRYMKNDSLPKIALAHLGNSDYLDRSVKDQKCIKLAHLHSKAVDYVKTGEPAVMDKSDNPRMWPHFMEKKHKRQYHSDKILGQLYDKVQSVEFTPNYEASFDDRILQAYSPASCILKLARQAKSKYDTAIRRIMAQQEIKTEFEVWSTFILSKPRVGSDYKVQENMGVIGGALKDRFRKFCIEQAGGVEFERLAPFVAAMYRVTYEEMQIALSESQTKIMVGGNEILKRKMEPKSMPLMSFPWLFHDILGRIATGITTREANEDLGLPFLATKAQQTSRKVSESSLLDDEDIIETSKGIITHHGEVLELFGLDIVDSDGNDVETPERETTVDDDAKTDEEVKPLNFDPLYDVSPPRTPQPVEPSRSRTFMSLLSPPPMSQNSTPSVKNEVESGDIENELRHQKAFVESLDDENSLTNESWDTAPDYVPDSEINLTEAEIGDHDSTMIRPTTTEDIGWIMGLSPAKMKQLTIRSTDSSGQRVINSPINSSFNNSEQLQLPSIDSFTKRNKSPVSASSLADLSELSFAPLQSTLPSITSKNHENESNSHRVNQSSQPMIEKGHDILDKPISGLGSEHPERAINIDRIDNKWRALDTLSVSKETTEAPNGQSLIDFDEESLEKEERVTRSSSVGDSVLKELIELAISNTEDPQVEERVTLGPSKGETDLERLEKLLQKI